MNAKVEEMNELISWTAFRPKRFTQLNSKSGKIIVREVFFVDHAQQFRVDHLPEKGYHWSALEEDYFLNEDHHMIKGVPMSKEEASVYCGKVILLDLRTAEAEYVELDKQNWMRYKLDTKNGPRAYWKLSYGKNYVFLMPT